MRYGVEAQVVIEQPRQSDFGEMAVPVAFQLAKQLRQAPKKIAAELVEEIGADSTGVAAWKWRATATSTSVSTAARTARRCCSGPKSAEADG